MYNWVKLSIQEKPPIVLYLQAASFRLNNKAKQVFSL